jgi:hypothetical protein
MLLPWRRSSAAKEELIVTVDQLKRKFRNFPSAIFTERKAQ